MNDLCSGHCAHCCKDLAVAATGKPKVCGKCRSFAYCNVECQKADWGAHKTICTPSSIYVLQKVVSLHASGEWRKLIKWQPYLESLIASMRLVAKPQVDADLIKIRRIFVDGYKLGIQSTDDPDNAYAKAAVALLDQMVKLQGKLKLFSDQGSSLCDLAGMERRVLGYYNKDSVAYYKRASAIAVRHDIPSVQARACLGLGLVAEHLGRYEEAAKLLRTAVLTLRRVFNSGLDLQCIRELIEVLFMLNAIDEAETFILRCPRLIQQAQGGVDSMRLSPMHLTYHLHSARVHEARGETEEAECEVRKVIALVHENKSAIHDWRPTLLKILDNANTNIKILDPVTGNKSLVKSMADLTHKQRMPTGYTQDGVKWREILIER